MLHTNGVVRAIGILAIDKSIVVVIDAIVAYFRFGQTVRRKETGRVRAVDLVVAIVVDSVIANFGRTILTSWRNEARRIGAINEFVAVFIEATHTHFGFARRHTHAGEYAATFRIRAIDEQIAIIVRFIATIFSNCLACAIRRRNAIAVVAIDRSIAIVVESIVTRGRFVRQTSARRRALTFGVETIDDLVAIVIDSVVAHFPARRRNTTTLRRLFTHRIGTIRNTITIVVRTIRAVFSITWKNLRIHVIAIATTTQEWRETIVVIVARTVDANSGITGVRRTRIVIDALLRSHTFSTAALTSPARSAALATLPRLTCITACARPRPG